MNNIYLKKFLNLINFLSARIILLIIHTGKREIIKNTLLITRLDSIGDYVLFRNYLAFLKQSKKYKDYSITLCGNIIWKDIAESFDSDVVNDFIWINRKKFYSGLSYKFRILKYVYRRGFEVAIDSAYTREVLYSDIIIKAANAKIKIGSKGSLDKHAYWKRRFFSDSFYDLLIDQTENNLFEFNRNKEFFEKVTGEHILFNKPELNLSGIDCDIRLPEKYVVVFPGSNAVERRWEAANYAEICQYLIFDCSLPVVIPGASNEKFIVDIISQKVKSDKLLDLSGKTGLTELVKVISDCEFLVSNDTSAVHIAVAVNKPFICISNGNHYGRFVPYPGNIYDNCEYLFPPEIMDNLNSPEVLSEKYRFNSTLDINKITVDQVIEKINLIMSRN